MWGISYTNLMMLGATIPKYESPDEKKKEKPKMVDGLDEIEFLKNT